MQWTRFTPQAALAAAGALTLVALACRDSAAPADGSIAAASVSLTTTASPELVDILRAKMNRFREFSNAAPGGYAAQITACMADPTLGGMGFHFANPGLIDGTVKFDELEALVYAPQPGGWNKLVAAEFLVPYTFVPKTGPAPRLFNRDFVPNDAFGLWMMHVWLWQPNPAGLFATWNPTVSCPPGTTVMNH